MKNVDIKEVLKTAGILTAICVVVTLLLAGTYIITKEPIEQTAAKEKAQAQSAVLPADEYIDIEGENASVAISNGRVIGCVITTQAKGYGGDIKVMTGILMTGDITGVQILSMSETPGVGTKTNNDNFLSQFLTVSLSDVSPSDIPTEPWGAIDNFELDGTRVDAITGATISSRAVTSAINDALRIYSRLAAEGKLILPADYSASAPALPVSPSNAAIPGMTQSPSDAVIPVVAEYPADITGGVQ